MNERQYSTGVAGVDVSKRRLDAAVLGRDEAWAGDNSEEGIAALIAWLRERGVGRVGLEATGGYERRLDQALQVAGMERVVHQPTQVKAFARFRGLRAKTDDWMPD